ncbi:MAG: Hint domain-containing protein [Marinosulfonomonas sp.]|nr:Hint domain-containing protein [Marinosulfonomonas sp.]
MAIISATIDGQTIVVGNGDTVVIDIAGGGTVNIVAQPGATISIFRIRFVNDNEADTVNIDLSTFTSYGLHIDIKDYDASDTVNLLSAFNTHVESGNTDEFQFQYIGANGATFDGYVRAKDNGERDFTADPKPINICFAQGTVIDTDLGPRPVESLLPGDQVCTQDRGLQPVRWIGRRVLDTLDLARHPHLRPVRFAAGSLGQGLPYRDLVVSPQHRMHVSGWRAELNFGEDEMLVPAIGFVNDHNVMVDKNTVCVTYFHLLFDQHEIITANGVLAESLHSGDMAIASMNTAAKEELSLIFPDAPMLENRETARFVARRQEAIAAVYRSA